jgi:hypothetical protein
VTKTRNTDRKRILQIVLAETGGTPIVLEELRWRVMRHELAKEKEPVAAMTESYQKCFNRTLRSFLPVLAPRLRIHRIGSGWTAGLVARVAVYRLEHVAQLDLFLACPSASLHFWSNSRTADVWAEVIDGEIEVRNKELLPKNAPDKLEPLYAYESRWPYSSIQRQQGLEQLGPKYIKRPLVCVKVCTRDVESPQEADVLAIIRMPANQPLLVIGGTELEEAELRRVEPVPWKLFQRRSGVTRVVTAGNIVR